MRPDNRLGRIDPSLEQAGDLGADAARLETAAPVSRAARAGSGVAGKTLKSPPLEVPALHREAERDTTVNFDRQHPLHTWIGPRLQGRRGPDVPLQHSRLFHVIVLRHD
jgi:hypothetical protein